MNIDKLLSATCDLESGHPIEAVLEKHKMWDRFRVKTAYEAVRQYALALSRSDSARTPAGKIHWATRAKCIKPCVEDIAAHLGLDK